MNLPLTTLASLTMSACALLVAASPKAGTTTTSPRELFEVTDNSRQLSNGVEKEPSLHASDVVRTSATATSYVLKAADGKSSEFVGICKNGSSVSMSKTTLDNPPSSEVLNTSSFSGVEAKSGVYINGKYHVFTELYGICFYSALDESVNWADNGSMQPVFPALTPTSLTYDATTSTVYGCFAEGASYKFSVFNISGVTKTDIATLSRNYPAMAAAPSGIIYAIGDDNKFYTIDKATADATEIGETGITATGVQSLCFDNDGTTLYWFVNDAVYTVDTSNGATSVYMTFPDNYGQWFSVFALPEFEIVTPAWVDDFTVNFTNDALSGEVSMTMPTTSTTGKAITGSMNYHIFVDNQEINEQKEAEPGAKVTCQATLEKGNHEFRAYAEYEGTKGLEVKLTKFIGHDAPSTPANISLLEDDKNVVTISWDKVTAGQNKGYIDVDAVRYTVVRQPGNVSIAEGIEATSCTDATINSLGYYTYEITATDGVTTSAAGVSDEHFPGSNLGFIPPFMHDFATGLGLFDVHDSNKDGVTWVYSDQFVWFQTKANTENNDWIVSPPITLEADKVYSLLVQLMGSVNMEYQVVELCYGKGPKPEELTTVILPAYSFQGNKDISTEITVPDDGQYYVGVHVVTKNAAGAICIRQFSIGAGYNLQAPGTAANLVITPADNGDAQALISFTCPDKNFGNTELTSLTRVVVTNETTSRMVADLSDVAPGKQITDVVDDNPAKGLNNYSVVCYNGYGSSKAVSSSCWIGLDTPAKPGNVSWIQNGNSVRLTWEAPTKGTHEGFIDPNGLTYRVTYADQNHTLLTETTDLCYEFTPEFTTAQSLLAFEVTAVNEAGAGEPGLSNQSAAGTPYSVPFFESFENSGLHSTPWLVMPLEGSNAIGLINQIDGIVDAEGAPITAVDSDYGMAVYSPIAKGSTRLEMPLIDVSSLEKPVMKLWCFFLDDKTTITIQGNNNSGTEWVDMASVTKQSGANGWNIAVIPLDKFKGESHLQLGITCSTPEYASYVMFDKISIEDGLDTDLVLADVTFPGTLYAGQDFTSRLKVNNGGLQESPAYEVQLFIDGKFASSAAGEIIPSGGSVEIPITAHLSSNATSATLRALVVCNSDEDTSNNALESKVHVVRSSLPAPTDLVNLSGSDSNDIQLSWTAPESRYEAPITDSFETLESGSIGGIEVDLDAEGNVVVTNNTGMLGGYKLVDNDKLTTTTVPPLLSVPNTQRGMVCQVIDVEEYGLRGNSSIWEAHSGNKVLAFWKCKRYDPEEKVDKDDMPNDDWFILPQLSENNKLISFWAKSLTNRYGLETFDIMVSAEGNDIDDFETFSQATEVPAGYADSPDHGFVLYEFELPEEAQYAAIRYNSVGTLALLIDDLTYTPAGEYTEAHLIGYNIYRNDVRINEAPLSENELKDIPEDGDYYYNVTAVYTEGESPYSNTVTVSGFSGISTLTTDGECAISVENRSIVVASPAPVVAKVYSTNGCLLREANVDGKVYITMAPGFYIVKAGSTARILVIK